ncbi:hypothetical protein M378DRAFT_11992 [Amanita muscaria Koide BX008]|uniref:Uncharacterized protein n=1 Tax=Amanita muscaria (strain Koide BX008) TaxID=946122 RepID=A0A0C2X3F4_AMAMK|nr:hypothetical protein M378DRAFT_11992 [Amanita muscaria Koide BX008]
MSTSRLTRLATAHTSISLIRKYLKEGSFTQQSFVNVTTDSIHRTVILKELESVAQNLHFPLIDPIRLRAAYPEFWKVADELYGVRNILTYKYGITEVDFNAIWNLITGPLENVIEPNIKVLAEQIDEEEERGTPAKTLLALS